MANWSLHLAAAGHGRRLLTTSHVEGAGLVLCSKGGRRARPTQTMLVKLRMLGVSARRAGSVVSSHLRGGRRGQRRGTHENESLSTERAQQGRIS